MSYNPPKNPTQGISSDPDRPLPPAELWRDAAWRIDFGIADKRSEHPSPDDPLSDAEMCAVLAQCAIDEEMLADESAETPEGRASIKALIDQTDPERLPALAADMIGAVGRDMVLRAHREAYVAACYKAENAPYLARALAAMAKAKAAEAAASVEQDAAALVAWFNEYLENDAPTATEGQGGELTTLARVAGVGKDHGLSEGQTFTSMFESPWNERCAPPWPFEQLQVKVHNVFLYCHQNAPGSATAEADFFGPSEYDGPLTAKQIRAAEKIKRTIPRRRVHYAPRKPRPRRI